MGQEDGKANGDAGVLPAGGRRGDGRFPNHEAEDKGPEHLPDQYASDAKTVVDDIGANAPSHVIAAREDRAKESGTNKGAYQLREQVGKALVPRNLAPENERECHRAVDLPPGVMSDRVCEDQDSHAKGQGHDQPARTVAGAVSARRAAADDDEERHCDALGGNGLHVHHFEAGLSCFCHAQGIAVHAPLEADHVAPWMKRPTVLWSATGS
mmetsp:Transcript_118432/g.166490  ORF Transcript_118432/g.166490 Transcript_118432/m.166490 type:complete len:211 (-) Transcript_118432:22-654(-)